MSLDVYLEWDGDKVAGSVGSGIFVRREGRTEEISREEWDRLCPGREPMIAQPGPYTLVYSANITHNLNRMADEAGIYKALWRPEEIGITHARQLFEPLRDGLALLHSEPERFKALNPANGWGDYEGLLRFVVEYLVACCTYPEARVEVSR